MKNLIIYLSLFFFSFLNAGAQNFFENGNKLFKENKFEEAAAEYEKQISQGDVSAELFFNCGNAYYKANQIGKAILMYEKALKLAPNDEDISVNLQIANKRTTDKVDYTPDFILTKMWIQFCLKYNADVWAILSVAAFILALASVFLIIVTKQNVNLYSISMLVMLAFTALFYFSGRMNNERLNGNSHAVILTSTVNIKSAPEQNSKELFVLHEGTKVEIISTENNWINIKLPNGNEGWIETSKIGVI